MSKFVRIKDNVKNFVEDHRVFFSISAAFLSGLSAFYGYVEKKNHQKYLESQIKTLHKEIKGNSSTTNTNFLNFNCNGRYVSFYFKFKRFLVGLFCICFFIDGIYFWIHERNTKIKTTNKKVNGTN